MNVMTSKKIRFRQIRPAEKPVDKAKDPVMLEPHQSHNKKTADKTHKLGYQVDKGLVKRFRGVLYDLRRRDLDLEYQKGNNDSKNRIAEKYNSLKRNCGMFLVFVHFLNLFYLKN